MECPPNAAVLYIQEFVNGLALETINETGMVMLAGISGSNWHSHVYREIDNVTYAEQCQGYCLLEYTRTCHYSVNIGFKCYLGDFYEVNPVVGPNPLPGDVYIKHNGKFLKTFLNYYCAVPIHGHIDATRTENLWVRYISHATSLMHTHCI